MEYSVRQVTAGFTRNRRLRLVWRLCFRHAAGEPWTPVLGSPEFRTKKEANALLLQVVNGR